MTVPASLHWTPRLHFILGAAAEIARADGRSNIGVEHVVMAILHDDMTLSHQVLAEFADLEAVERRLRELLAG